jgi:hypothetical protein
MAIVTASLPSLYPLFRSIMNRYNFHHGLSLSDTARQNQYFNQGHPNSTGFGTQSSVSAAFPLKSLDRQGRYSKMPGKSTIRKNERVSYDYGDEMEVPIRSDIREKDSLDLGKEDIHKTVEYSISRSPVPLHRNS